MDIPAAEAKPVETPASKPKTQVMNDLPIAYGPAVALMLHRYGIKDPSVVPRSSSKRWLLKGDLLQWIDQQQLKPVQSIASSLPHPLASETELYVPKAPKAKSESLQSAVPLNQRFLLGTPFYPHIVGSLAATWQEDLDLLTELTWSPLVEPPTTNTLASASSNGNDLDAFL